MKKWIAIIVLIACLCNHGQAQTDTGNVYLFCYFKGNSADGLHLAYSNNALEWKALNNDSSLLKPDVGVDKLMRDPCITKGPDGKFHMVWTVSWKEKGIGYASSDDLVHWSKQQYIPVMEHESAAQNAWAPEIVYDAAKKQFIIFWATTIPGRFPATDSMGDYNHRIYYVTTKDFKTYSKAALLYNKGFNVIDATIMPYGKKYVMFLKDETKTPPQKNLRVATSKKLLSGWTAPSAPITGKYWAEGPTALQVNNNWIVYFDKYRDHKYGAVTSPDLKNWTDISDKVIFPKGIRHGTAFAVTRAEFERLTSLLK